MGLNELGRIFLGRKRRQSEARQLLIPAIDKAIRKAQLAAGVVAKQYQLADSMLASGGQQPLQGSLLDKAIRTVAQEKDASTQEVAQAYVDVSAELAAQMEQGSATSVFIEVSGTRKDGTVEYDARATASRTRKPQ